jgi:tRNA (guanine37-N1)-methyltransferase
MGNDGSGIEESFGEELLVEYPQYTRPARFRDWDVPEVLRSGDHARVDRWRKAQSLRRTLARRPDLMGRPLTPDEERVLAEFPPDEFPPDESGR